LPLAEGSSVNDSGPGSSDPYDVAVAPDGSLWVARYDTPSILIQHPDGTSATIDVSSYGVDGNPLAAAIRIVDGLGSPPASKAFVVLQRLDVAAGYTIVEPSMVLRVDVASQAVEAQIPLQGNDAFTTSAYDPASQSFYVAESGHWDAGVEPKAGIEAFDVTTSTSKMLVTKETLGNTPAEVAVSGGCGVAILADPSASNDTSLISFDPTTGEVIAPLSQPLLSTPGFYLQGLLWLGDVLLVGDGSPNVGYANVVHVFDRTGACTLTERPTPIAIPFKAVGLQPASP